MKTLHGYGWQVIIQVLLFGATLIGLLALAQHARALMLALLLVAAVGGLLYMSGVAMERLWRVCGWLSVRIRPNINQRARKLPCSTQEAN